jgi:lipoprotein-releasing system permease protein
MSFESFIGLRYLRARRSSSFVSTITVISVLGVGVGVWALIVVLSVMAGYEAEMRDKIIGTNAHGNLIKITYGFTEYREAVEKIKQVPEVIASTPFILREVMVSSETNVTGALIKGIDIDTVGAVTQLAEQVEVGGLDYLRNPEKLQSDTLAKREEDIAQGKLLPSFTSRTKRRWGDKVLPGVMIGKEMAKYLSVGVGDEINVVNPLGGGLGPTGPIPSNQYFRVAGIFYAGMFEYDMKFAYVTIEQLQKFSSMEDEVTAIEFKVKPDQFYNTGEIGQKIVAVLGGFPYKVRDWKDMNKNLFAALKLEQVAMFIILTFITLVAAFNIASTLIMVVIEKNKEIAILKSMGASNWSIMKIFMIDGLVIGIIGTAIGLVLGFATCALIPIIDLQLDADVYYVTSLPVIIQPMQIAIIIFSAIFISWLATVYPAWQASRLDPVDGLRNE